MTPDLLRRLLAPIQRRIMLLAARAIVRTVNDRPRMQEHQVSVLNGEVRDRVERMQEYGFTSVPQDNAEALVVFLGGRRDHGIIVATDDRRYRPTGLAKGEVSLYTDETSQVVLRRGNQIEIRSSSASGGALVTVKDGQITLQSSGAGGAAVATFKDGSAEVQADKFTAKNALGLPLIEADSATGKVALNSQQGAGVTILGSVVTIAGSAIVLTDVPPA